MSRRKRLLTAEDKDLWGRIRKTVTPLKGKAVVDEELETWMEHVTAAEPAAPQAVNVPVFPATPVKPFLPPYVPPVSQKTSGAPVLDDITMKKLRKGRLEIDARIDLHGMTEHAAHDALLRFIKQARREDARIVLIITGKGKGGEGVLRRSVPLWFAEAAFKPLVGGWRKAHPAHGGEGALYVRLRREARG
jgi:DNA-nicking Smr family endonuclease